MRLIQTVVVLVLAASALGAPAALAQDRGSQGADAVIFEAVVAELRAAAQGVLLVDPRTLQAGADLTSVDSAEVGRVSHDRERVLRRMEIPTTTFLSDRRCLFAHGLPPAPGFGTVTEEQRAAREECRARSPFTSAIVGPARGGGDTVTVAVAQMTTSAYTAREYVLRRCGSGVWRVIGMQTLIGPVQS